MEKDCRYIEELKEEGWLEYFLWMRLVICVILQKGFKENIS